MRESAPHSCAAMPKSARTATRRRRAIAIILAPIAALIIQLAVSRGREYGADRSGAELTGDPEGLALALQNLDVANRQRGGLFGLGRRSGGAPGRQAPMPAPAPAANPAFAHLYIVNPLSGRELGSLFSTHPPIADRMARLRAMERSRSF